MAEIHKNKCVVCEKVFDTSRKDKKTCSNACRAKLFRRNRRYILETKNLLIESVRDKGPVVKYLISHVRLCEDAGLNKIRMESIRNLSAALFRTPGEVPDKFSAGGYDFERITDNYYTFSKR